MWSGLGYVCELGLLDHFIFSSSFIFFFLFEKIFSYSFPFLKFFLITSRGSSLRSLRPSTFEVFIPFASLTSFKPLGCFSLCFRFKLIIINRSPHFIDWGHSLPISEQTKKIALNVHSNISWVVRHIGDGYTMKIQYSLLSPFKAVVTYDESRVHHDRPVSSIV